MTNDQLLIDFLIDAFSLDELEDLVRDLGGERLLAKIESGQRNSLARGLVHHLERHGRIDRQFFGVLVQHRPARKIEIRELAALFDVVDVELEAPPGALLEAYRRQLIAEHRWLDLGILGPRGAPIKLPLAEVFLPLRMLPVIPESADTFSAHERRQLDRLLDARFEEVSWEEFDSLRFDRWRTRQQQGQVSRSLEQWFSEAPGGAVLVLGDPGSGKSTCLRHLAQAVAKKPDAPVPIFVPLAAYDEWLSREPEGDRSLFRFFGVYAREWGQLDGADALFRWALGSGRALVLLDGLDEVRTRDLRIFVAKQVNTLLSAHSASSNRFVITSRFVGYRDLEVFLDAPHFSIPALSEGDVQKLAETLYRQLAIQQLSKRTDEEASQNTEALMAQYRQRQDLRELASTPLLVTMLALLQQTSDLPQHRIELYQRFLELLVGTWRRVRSLGARQKNPSEKHEGHFLAQLALWMHRRYAARTAPRAAVLQELARIVLRLDGYGEEDDPFEESGPRLRLEAEERAASLLDALRGEAGVLIERGPERLGFRHKSFQEYYTARALASASRDERWALLRPRLHDDQWRVPILLCAAQLGIVDQRLPELGRLVACILDAGSEMEPLLHRDLFFAADIAAEDVMLPRKKVDQIAERLKAVCDAQDNRAAVQAAMQRLVTLSSCSDRAVQLVMGYLTGSEPGLQDSAFQMCRGMFDALPNGPLIEWFAEQAMSGEDRRLRSNALLSLCFSDDSEKGKVTLDVVDKILQGASGDDLFDFIHFSFVVRRDKISENRRHLTEKLYHWCVANELWDFVATVLPLCLRWMPDTEEIYRALLNSPLKRLLIEFTAMTAADVPIIRDILVEHLSDEDAHIRKHSLIGVSGLFKDCPDLIVAARPLLFDSDAEIRTEAIRLIAPHLGDDELSGFVFSEESESVRGGLVRAFAAEGRPDEIAVPVLLAALDDESKDVRGYAIALSKNRLSSSDELVSSLMGRLHDCEPNCQNQAISALGGLASQDAQVRRALIERLDALSAPQVQERQIETVLPLVDQDPLLQDQLLQLLEHPREAVRRACVNVLGAFLVQRPAWRERFEERLSDKNSSIRTKAAVSLLSSGAELDVAALLADDRLESAQLLSIVRHYPGQFSWEGALVQRIYDDPKRRYMLGPMWAQRHEFSPDAATLIEQVGQAALEWAGLQGVGSGSSVLHKSYAVRMVAEQLEYLSSLNPSFLATVLQKSALRERVLQGLEGPLVGRLLPLLEDAEDIVRHVAPFLQDERPLVRALAVRCFAHRPAFAQISEANMQQWLEDKEVAVRAAARESLARGDAARRRGFRAQIAAGLSDSGDLVRAWSAKTILEDEVLCRALLEEVRPWLSASGRFVHVTAHINMTSYMWGADAPATPIMGAELRRLAARSLAPLLVDPAERVGLVTALEDPDWMVRQGAVWTLLRQDEPPLEAIRAQLSDLRGLESWTLRLGVASALRNSLNQELDQKVTEVALEGLQFGHEPWRATIDVGGEVSGPSVRKLAVGVLAGIDPRYRSEEVVSALTKVCLSDPEDSVRGSAWNALMKMVSSPPPEEGQETRAAR